MTVFFRHPVKSIRETGPSCVAFETADWKDDKKLGFFFHRYQHLCLLLLPNTKLKKFHKCRHFCLRSCFNTNMGYNKADWPVWQISAGVYSPYVFGMVHAAFHNSEARGPVISLGRSRMSWMRSGRSNASLWHVSASISFDCSMWWPLQL